MLKYIVPLILFVVLAVFLAIGLHLNPKEIPSPLIGKSAPAFSLPVLNDPDRSMTPNDMLGKVWLLNVWASWCVSCREEHPLLMQLAGQGVVPMIGLNYKDEPQAAARLLQRNGNPYTASIIDAEGRTGIDYGVYGVPETFVIDKFGIIRYKHTGPVDSEFLQDVLLPLVQQLQREPA